MKRILSMILALCMTLTLSSCAPAKSPRQTSVADGEMAVHFIDVGQGDSTLLECGGEYVLIDAGEREYGSKVVDYIEQQGADSLKYVIATHPHSDHVGGLKEVIECIDCENFITSETDQTTHTWMNVLKAVDEYDVNYIDAAVGDTYTFGTAQFTILAPNSASYSGYNNYSVAARVTFGITAFMLTGDAEKQSESEMLSLGTELSADVLKCGHHGSSTSSTAGFLKAVDPDYAVISCGKNNEYGHPHKETLKKLALLGTQVYRTDTMGTIVAVSDGESIRFTCETAAYAPSAYAASEEHSSYYIGNKNSMVFHRPSCSGVSTMSGKNKVTLDTREDAIAQGYSPCGKCDP